MRASTSRPWCARSSGRGACWTARGSSARSTAKRVRRLALGVAALALGRAVRPGWPLLAPLPVTRWLAWLADDDPLVVAAGQLGDALAGLTWASEECRRAGVRTGVRIMLAGGLRSLGQITEQDLTGAPPRATSGLDALDAALCAA